ncbi:serine protease 37 precursor [Nasonia vitripennis]|uniref:Peptidase S1 domain-containing protein n=1 Tax=Nasonia vitripennis TaxID=7425 RepID=A0A7M6UDR1_NASVI|nr:serine protease 37 precursor [Nasonia vitripennis]
MRGLLGVFLIVALPLTFAHIIENKLHLPNILEKHLGGARANTTAPEEDKFFLNWLQNVLGYNPPITITSTTQPPTVEAEKCAACYCGVTNKQTRIVGGHETMVNEYPWVALLTYKGRFYCGASVINSKYVLTAAHCVDRFQKTLMGVRILEHDRNSTQETMTKDYRVQEIIRHAGYSTVNYNNDIALIKIDGEFEFDNRMKPVCLAERAKTFTGETGIATGWGAIEEGGPVSTTLREVSVPIMSNADCKASKYPARKITDNMLCAGYKEGQKDSCQGDSGGPLHIMSEGVHRIVGIVSWGEGCAQPGYPGVYTRVNRYITWITKNTADACYCTDHVTLRV